MQLRQQMIAESDTTRLDEDAMRDDGSKKGRWMMGDDDGERGD